MSSDSDSKKLMASAVPESKKRHQNMLSMSLKVKKVKKVTSRSNLVLRKFKPSHFINKDLIHSEY